MMELVIGKELVRAIDNARSGRLNWVANATSWPRQYEVTNHAAGVEHVVYFYPPGGGTLFVDCTCMAHLKPRICSHIAAAAARHMSGPAWADLLRQCAA